MVRKGFPKEVALDLTAEGEVRVKPDKNGTGTPGRDNVPCGEGEQDAIGCSRATHRAKHRSERSRVTRKKFLFWVSIKRDEA